VITRIKSTDKIDRSYCDFQYKEHNIFGKLLRRDVKVRLNSLNKRDGNGEELKSGIQDKDPNSPAFI
jgi:hypothetical protein